MLKTVLVGRIMCTLFGLMVCQATLTPVHAKDVSIIEVRKNIPLSDTDPIYRDYYLDGGSAEGLKKGMTVTLVRSVTLKEATEEKAALAIAVPIGSLSLIHVQDNVSVGRLSHTFSREKLPVVEHQALMVGDRIDLALAEKDFLPAAVKPLEKKKSGKAPAQKVASRD